MSTLSLLAPAKLNLCLKITGRRDDGYHLLQSLFQLLDFGDTLHFAARSDTEITLHTPFDGVAPQDNLIVRAACALRAATDTRHGVDIHCDKRLPMGGGIGGGSSNAATTLLALNRLWQTGLSENALSEIGLALGADVPVFVRGRTAWAEGVGEKLTPVEMPEDWFVVIHPGVSVATREIFFTPAIDT